MTMSHFFKVQAFINQLCYPLFGNVSLCEFHVNSCVGLLLINIPVSMTLLFWKIMLIWKYKNRNFIPSLYLFLNSLKYKNGNFIPNI